MMYVPGNDWKKINKIPSLEADSFILDCEDGVALNRKVSWYGACLTVYLIC
jgi:citrate lyase subunit beta-like protein